MPDLEQYKALMSDIISKQAVILGPDIAVLRARNVEGLEVSNEGRVTDIKGDPGQSLEQLVDEYVSLSGQIVKSALGSVFEKHPDIKNVIQ
ncbi:MAG: hypothetical protein COV29_03880 [Candidatus Yanofskybacteria bacterium CG10_big_fil_rev_8_21_14_0_10_36_16]|uniref:Uncharacterized protein n=1 Tax=Candidatus Yanofskybacteria bacterium CG10_big_fil_rev_8_21_14_0_10_36_16 TaxID=1975096 RepID=A0A2J0Q6Z7_9BACT|nr:MAG: hypothetical protein COV29_03880 [Candidatus Yanofskybacteria bacterium CG10_big_fil_rev_8_21_14_0_10_36_16]